MGLLRHSSSGRTVVLGSPCFVGRALGSGVLLSDGKASNQHASLRWNGDHWEVTDLGSRNGSFLREERLRPNARRLLHQGDWLHFGRAEERWELIDAQGPGVIARRIGSDEVRVAEAGALALPEEADAAITIVTDGHGWFVETGEGERKPVRDKQTLQVGEHTWELSVPPSPSKSTPTIETQERRPLDRLLLRFHVSLNEEHISLDLVDGGRVDPLGERAAFYLLVFLARERRRDQEGGTLPEPEQGWVDISVLRAKTYMTEKAINLHVHRIRDVFRNAGVSDGIVERRAGQIRIGTATCQELSP